MEPVDEACVSLLRVSSWTSRLPLWPRDGGSSEPSLARKLFIEGHTAICERRSRSAAPTAGRAPPCGPAAVREFIVNTVGAYTGSCPSPTNQRYSRLQSSAASRSGSRRAPAAAAPQQPSAVGSALTVWLGRTDFLNCALTRIKAQSVSREDKAVCGVDPFGRPDGRWHLAKEYGDETG